MTNNEKFIQEYNKRIARNKKIANALYHIEKTRNENAGYNYYNITRNTFSDLSQYTKLWN